MAADAIDFVHSVHLAWNMVVVGRIQALLAAFGQVKHTIVDSLVRCAVSPSSSFSHRMFQAIFLAAVLDDVPHILFAAVSLVLAVRAAWNTMVAARVSSIPGQVGRLIFGSLVSRMFPNPSSFPNLLQAGLLIARS